MDHGNSKRTRYTDSDLKLIGLKINLKQRDEASSHTSSVTAKYLPTGRAQKWTTKGYSFLIALSGVVLSAGDEWSPAWWKGADTQITQYNISSAICLMSGFLGTGGLRASVLSCC